MFDHIAVPDGQREFAMPGLRVADQKGPVLIHRQHQQLLGINASEFAKVPTAD
jgi:hypothetical protein